MNLLLYCGPSAAPTVVVPRYDSTGAACWLTYMVHRTNQNPNEEVGATDLLNSMQLDFSQANGEMDQQRRRYSTNRATHTSALLPQVAVRRAQVLAKRQ